MVDAGVASERGPRGIAVAGHHIADSRGDARRHCQVSLPRQSWVLSDGFELSQEVGSCCVTLPARLRALDRGRNRVRTKQVACTPISSMKRAKAHHIQGRHWRLLCDLRKDRGRGHEDRARFCVLSCRR